jgi:hypothetical protein
MTDEYDWKYECKYDIYMEYLKKDKDNPVNNALIQVLTIHLGENMWCRCLSCPDECQVCYYESTSRDGTKKMLNVESPCNTYFEAAKCVEEMMAKEQIV